MRKCKHITCWTDYPFVELGDEPGKRAPIRHVNIVSYDGDKYAKVSFENCGDVLDVKIGYLYSKRGRYGQVKQVNRRKIERMGDGKRARESDRFYRNMAKRQRRHEEMDRQVLAFVIKNGLFGCTWQEAYQRWYEYHGKA